MKRSEMIENIYKELVFSRKPMHGIRITNSPADKELAETILNTMEEAGMLPPFRSLEKDNKSNHYEIAKWEVDWEPEDERSTEES